MEDDHSDGSDTGKDEEPSRVFSTHCGVGRFKVYYAMVCAYLGAVVALVVPV